MTLLTHLWKDEQGQDLIEYTLLMAFVALASAALFLGAGGYHHHLGTNTWATGAPRPADDDARLLEWTVVVPSAADAAAVAKSLEGGGYSVTEDAERRSWTTTDPWGTPIRIAPEGSVR